MIENISCVRLKFYYFSRLSHNTTGCVLLSYKCHFICWSLRWVVCVFMWFLL